MPGRVIYLVRSWPRLSQTFILNEVMALERRGVQLAIFSLVASGETMVQDGVGRVRSPVHFLDGPGSPPVARLRLHVAALLAAPAAYLRTLLLCLCRPRLAAGYGECSALRCFALALRVTSEVNRLRARGEEVRHVHAHFAHDPALVGMLTARLCRLPFTFTAHARDLVQIPVAALTARTAPARAVVTCCEVNAAYITAAVPARLRPPVHVIHHGVDLVRFSPAQRAGGHTPRLVSVGRLVEKKGYADLLRALALVRDVDPDFRCRIFGDGPLQEQLIGLRDRLGLRGQVRFEGAHGSDRIAAELRAADIFVLTPRVTTDGDRDGIPNVLVEAMATGLPVVTTSAGGITELVQHGTNGLVAPTGRVQPIAELLTTLLTDRELRGRLGAAARETVESDYDLDGAAGRLEQLLLPPAPALEVVG